MGIYQRDQLKLVVTESQHNNPVIQNEIFFKKSSPQSYGKGARVIITTILQKRRLRLNSLTISDVANTYCLDTLLGIRHLGSQCFYLYFLL